MPLDPDAPITTREFLSWVTAERKHQRWQVMLVAIVLTVFVVIISGASLITYQLTTADNKNTLANQGDIAQLRAVHSAAVTANEVKLCRIVRDFVDRQRTMIQLGVTQSPLSDRLYEAQKDAFTAPELQEALRNRKVLIHKLQLYSRHFPTPACDGFPAVPDVNAK